MDTRKPVDSNAARWEAHYELKKALKELRRAARRCDRARKLLTAAGKRGCDMLAISTPLLLHPVREVIELADRDIELDIPF